MRWGSWPTPKRLAALAVLPVCLFLASLLYGTFNYGNGVRARQLEHARAGRAQTAGPAASASEAPRAGQTMAPPNRPAGPSAGMPYRTWSGATSGITRPCQYRITTVRAWKELWGRHTGSRTVSGSSGRPAAPPVDFTQCMVVAVFRGEVANNKGVEVHSVSEGKDALVIRCSDRSFQSGAKGVPCTPYGIFVMPRSTKPLVLMEDVRVRIQGPPVWKEFARFGAQR